MKHFRYITPQNIFDVSKLKELDKRVETCDWVAVYVTQGGLIARLVSYKPQGNAWQVGFKYVDGNSTTHRRKNELHFESWNHQEAIENALKAGRDVLLFEDEYEFINWYNINKRSHC